MSKRNVNTASDTITLGQLFGDMRLLIILFLAFRLLLLLAYEPLRLAEIERGLSAGGDFQYYYQLGALSDRGLLPFRDWWSEFPPIPSIMITLLYQLAGRGENYSGFAIALGLIMLACDTGNLLLVRRIGTRLHGANTGMALAWIYALLGASAVFVWWNFEPLAAFLLLLALGTLLDGRDSRSAVWAALGILVKFTPAVVGAAALRFRPRVAGIRYIGIVLAVVAGVYGLLMAQNAAFTLPSLTAQFNKSSYQTVWALIDGNYRTGNFGTAEERLDPDTASVLTGNPAVIPGWFRLLAALGLGLVVFLTARRMDDKGIVAFVTLALLIFFLQAQGWSPQWLAQIIPLVLLCFPNRLGVQVIVLLSIATFAEYPFLFLRTGDTGGEITGALQSPFILLVIARTAILVGISIALYRRLRQPAVMP
ncbi:hypothetical protein FBR02_11505 [Anaerolineae bacterium CFX9]|nr:hypothetical protein [Anaerolineae bacterium CFX9]